ncbi:peptide deformylase [Candidatus Carsonella ruddii HT isolate Thao2000]|uniref:Peptide deformylase n=1 Tax=Candidatus Carsonella ruddii HT isolate Thao2000 TaxID=1202539 RepID=J3TWE9_CARRU|nr:peptide deformylase [Candidatus Carsonella ruddii]AFP84220.1 peptide deformylase [Candidatus Carsonella ruddii HT isolate Thao2000]
MFNIININDKRIRFISKKIIKYNKIKKLYLIKQMIIIMLKNKGIGISSTQLNINFDIIIINIKKNKILILINPLILKKSKLCTISNEGCLSIINFFSSIIRPEKIFLNYINLFNKCKKKIFNNLISRCIQHEIDHLFGILIIDYYKIIIK